MSEQNAREEAAVTISNVKEEYSVKIAAANKKEQEARQLIEEEEIRINRLSESKITDIVSYMDYWQPCLLL